MTIERRASARTRRAQGLALLEVLVALALCSVGLIGAGALVLQQMAAMRALEHDQFARDQLHDMAGVLRAAMPAGRASERESGATRSADLAGGAPRVPDAGVDAGADDPPPAVMEALRAWQLAVATRLPDGQAALLRARDDEPGAWRLEIRWQDSGAGPGSEPILRQRDGLVLP